jgi:hypothetical protein
MKVFKFWSFLASDMMCLEAIKLALIGSIINSSKFYPLMRFLALFRFLASFNNEEIRLKSKWESFQLLGFFGFRHDVPGSNEIGPNRVHHQ